MPTKNSDIILPSRYYVRDTINANPAYRTLSVISSTKKVRRQRTGVSLPTFRQVIRDGGNATTDMSGTFSSLEAARNSIHLRYRRPSPINDVVEQEQYGDICLSGIGEPVFVPFTSQAGSRASSKILEKIRELEVQMSGPTFLGELRETQRMLRHPAEALTRNVERYLNDLKRVNAENRRKYFKKDHARYDQNLVSAASGLWLEQAFGWSPLLKDIDDAQKAYNSLFEIDRVVKCSAGGTDSKLGAETVTSSTFTGTKLIFRVYTRLVYRVKVRYKCAVRARAASTAADRLQRFGFTPSEFAPTAWELLPWSFLIDYFANIGDMISASVTDTSNVIWTAKTQIQEVESLRTIQPDFAAIRAAVGAANIETLSGSSAYAKWSVRSVGRSPHAGIDFPTLYFTYPGSNGRLANCAALLAQVGLDIHPQRPSKRNWHL